MHPANLFGMQKTVQKGRIVSDLRDNQADAKLIERFKKDPQGAYDQLLERYSPIIIRMIRRFMRDPDEIMEVYTAICERFRANDFAVLRRFRLDSELTPWLSVVVANACRDRFRKRRASSIPNSVISKLDEREKLIFRLYYQDQHSHEEIAHAVSGQYGIPCTTFDVIKAVEKINDLLTINKRWHLLAAMNVNKAPVSIDELKEVGFQLESKTTSGGDGLSLDETERQYLMLSEAISELQPEDQLLVLLRFEQGMKAHQIAQVMQYENHKYVYTRLRTIVNRLRRILEVEVS